MAVLASKSSSKKKAAAGKGKSNKKPGLVKGHWRANKKAPSSPLKSPDNSVLTQAKAAAISSTFMSPTKDTGGEGQGCGQPVDLAHYSPFFRELDMSAFRVLSYDTVQIGSAGSEAGKYNDRKKTEFYLLRSSIKSLQKIGPKMHTSTIDFLQEV